MCFGRDEDVSWCDWDGRSECDGVPLHPQRCPLSQRKIFHFNSSAELFIRFNSVLTTDIVLKQFYRNLYIPVSNLIISEVSYKCMLTEQAGSDTNSRKQHEEPDSEGNHPHI